MDHAVQIRVIEGSTIDWYEKTRRQQRYGGARGSREPPIQDIHAGLTGAHQDRGEGGSQGSGLRTGGGHGTAIASAYKVGTCPVEGHLCPQAPLPHSPRPQAPLVSLAHSFPEYLLDTLEEPLPSGPTSFLPAPTCRPAPHSPLTTLPLHCCQRPCYQTLPL